MDLHFHYPESSNIGPLLNEIVGLLKTLVVKDKIIMAQLTDVVDAVAAENDVVASAVILLESLSAKLEEALASNDPAAVQAVVDSIKAQTDVLAAAVAASSPVPVEDAPVEDAPVEEAPPVEETP